MKCPKCKIKADKRFRRDDNEEYFYCGQCQYSFGFEETKRKIIQLSQDADGDMVALCNDGTVWYIKKGGWGQFEPIPQGDVK